MERNDDIVFSKSEKITKSKGGKKKADKKENRERMELGTRGKMNVEEEGDKAGRRK